MQEKEQIISPIKQRILYFAGTLGISKRDFYTKIGVSRGTLESKTGITEDVITKFFATYPEVNIEWLMTGRGDMLKTNHTSKKPTSDSEVLPRAKDNKKDIAKQDNSTDILLSIIQDKDSTIREQAVEIGQLRERISQLKRMLEKNASGAATSTIAGVG